MVFGSWFLIEYRDGKEVKSVQKSSCRRFDHDVPLI